MSRNSGFTLIEMMIVIAVIGILVSISTPAVISWLPNYRLRSAANDLVSNFQKAKLEAVKRNTDVLINFIPGTYTPTGRVGSYNMVDSGTGAILVQVTMPQNVSLYFENFSNHTTGYNSRGLPYLNRWGRVELQNNNSIYYKASLSSAGHVRRQKSNDGANWN